MMNKGAELPKFTPIPGGYQEEVYEQAQQDMLKAGYRKLPKDKPPLLGDEELSKFVEFPIEGYTSDRRGVAQAQYNVIMRHFGLPFRAGSGY